MLKRWLSVGLILIAVGLTSGVTAHADSDDSALATAPTGVTLTGDNPPLTPSTQALNRAQIAPSHTHPQVVTLTQGADQFGAVWSTNDHAFRLNRNQTVSAWLDLGQSADGGIAFVLQNDSQLLNAMPKFTTPIAETLGVWGVDTTPTQSSAKALSQTAIQNSWALAFDAGNHAQTNAQAPGQANSFDVGAASPHVAAGYPGAAATYQSHKVSGALDGLLTPNQYAYSLVHQGLLPVADLANGQWHHVTLRWRAAARTMTVTVNDRNPRTNAAQTGQRRTMAVDLNQVDPNHTGYARWGFTATTGPRATTDPLVVLTQLSQRTVTARKVTSRATKATTTQAPTSRATQTPVTVRLRGARTIKVAPLQRAVLNGQVTATAGRFPAGLRVTPVVDGHRLAPVRVMATGQLTTGIAAARLQPGTNRVKWVARIGTRQVAQSPTTTVDVTPGQLTFTALSTTAGFQRTKLPTTSELVPRQAGWQIEVQDTRGTGSRWTLLAQAGRFTNRATGRPMAGTPVFVNGQTMTPLGTTPTPIMTHTTNDGRAAGKTNVVAHWSTKTGVLLHAQPGTAAGRYQGKLTWTLTNAPE